MFAYRFWMVSCLAAGLALMLGAATAGASGTTTVLKFNDSAGQATGVGFDANNPNAIPPVGGSLVITLRLKNNGSQFGKPSGTIVGRVLLDCTVLSVDTTTRSIDGICTGIAHVPNGFFTFAGNGGFSDAKIIHYAITGGVGPYANDRGQITVVNAANGSSAATVALTP